jgi:hypothetical protein
VCPGVRGVRIDAVLEEAAGQESCAKPDHASADHDKGQQSKVMASEHVANPMGGPTALSPAKRSSHPWVNGLGPTACQGKARHGSGGLKSRGSPPGWFRPNVRSPE